MISCPMCGSNWKITRHPVEFIDGIARPCMHSWHDPQPAKQRPPAEETQQTVAAWAMETFGPSAGAASIAARANKEMAELVSQLTEEGPTPATGKEIADVIIVLMVLAERISVSIPEEINAKMAINRARKWVVKNGHGQHVEGT